MIRSPLYYQGDKYKLLPQILEHTPSNIKTFIDVFGGGGTMLANIESDKYFFNEIDPYVYSLLGYLKNQSSKKILKEVELNIKKYNLTYPTFADRAAVDINKLNKKGFDSLRADYNSLSLKSKNTFKGITMLFVLIIYGFNSQIRFNSKGIFNIPNGKQDLNNGRKKILLEFCDNIKIKNITLLNLDYKEAIDKIISQNDLTDSLFYFDPPYSLSNTTYNKIWNSEKDKELFQKLDELHKKGFRWSLSNILSTGDRTNELLKEWSKKYNLIELDFNYDNSNYQKKRVGKTKEVLVINY